MDPAKFRAWVAKQIEEHGVCDTPAVAGRLADAAAVIRDARPGRPLFGMMVPESGLANPMPLYERCLVLLRAWVPTLDDRTREDFQELLARLKLPIVAAVLDDSPVLRVHFYLEARASDLDTDEPIVDPAVLRQLDGAKETAPISLIDLPCLRMVTGGDFPVGREGRWGWANDGRIALRYDGGELRAHIEIDATRAPDDVELAALQRVIEKELFQTGWGHNLEWDFDIAEPTVSVFVTGRVVDQRVERCD